MEIKSEKIVTSYEAKKILRKREKESELNYEQKNALDYLNKFKKKAEKDIHGLLETLEKIEKLHDRHVVAIVETMPRDEDDLRLLFANERIVLEDSERQQILSAVKKVAK
jgi:DNA-directed RNA polymerase subunit F